MKSYFKDLSKKEKKHLREAAGVTTLAAFKRTAEKQKIMRDDPDPESFTEPCYECKNIARKLGLPV